MPMSNWYARSVFHVRDTPAALVFYESRLGFSEDWRFAEGERLRVVQISRSGCEVILTDQWPDQAGHGVLFLSLDRDDHAAAKVDLAARAAPMTAGNWGYELTILTDPDGNQLWIAEPGDG
jgi:uncharacterized glyoxalase superfamily protein PhnB